MTPLFYDSEFTGLHQHSTLISLALCAETGDEFYAEFSDFDRGQCDPWLRDHVLAHTRWVGADPPAPFVADEGRLRLCCGDRVRVRGELETWLRRFERVEIWADCPAYDWVLFCELFGGALHLPRPVFYIPFDLATLFRLKGLDPDTDREGFADLPASANGGPRHNALHDARVARGCYHRLMN